MTTTDAQHSVQAMPIDREDRAILFARDYACAMSTSMIALHMTVTHDLFLLRLHGLAAHEQLTTILADAAHKAMTVSLSTFELLSMAGAFVVATM